METDKHNRRKLLKGLSLGLAALAFAQIPLWAYFSRSRKNISPKNFLDGSIFQPREDQRRRVWSRWRDLD